jgi:2'-5' RNA ligase
MDIRCFIAVGITDQIKRGIGELIDILIEYDVDIKWVKPENLHLTLKFLGNTPDVLLPEIDKSLLNIVSSYEPFYIKICRTGVFPNRKYPRVIWVGVEDSEILVKLNRDIENSMKSLGYKKEDKDYKPHLTIGRVRSQTGIVHIVNELDHFTGKDFGIVHVDRLRLMKSELKTKGAEYSCLNEFLFSRKRLA